MEAVDRLSGVKLDPVRLDYELARRALRFRDLAELSGVGTGTLSRARNGYAIQPGTLRRITAALLATPVLAGADLVIAAPDMKKTAGGTQPPAVREERNAAATSITE